MTNIWSFWGFIAGLTSLLFVSTPFGRVSMLDFSTFFLAPIFLVTDFSRYSKPVKIVLALALLWLAGAIWSDFYRDTPFVIARKSNAIIFNAFTILVVGYHVLRRSPRAMMYFLLGNAISGFISLYAFQNGGMLGQAVKAGYTGGADMQDFLVEKMRWPFYITLVIYGLLMTLRMKRLVPWWFCALVFIGCGGYVLKQGDGRSAFLIYAGTGVLMAIYAYWPKLLRLLFGNRLRMLIIGGLSAIVLGVGYYAAARTGMLGEGNRAKAAAKDDGGSVLDTRVDVIMNWPFLWRSPLTGCGATYEVPADYSRIVRMNGFYGHSCLVGSWTEAGVWGLFFWLQAFFLFPKIMGRKIRGLGDFGPFFMGNAIGILWNILFSPYGMFRGLCMFSIVFVAMLEDPRYYAFTCAQYLPKMRRRLP